MERLTKRLPSGAADYNYSKNCYFDDGSGPDRIAQSAFRQRCVERLADYEDTKLTPEKIDMDHEAAETLRHLCRGCDLDWLEKLAEADKDGRVVVLPCKPGDTVYSIFGAEVIEKTVGRVIINGYTTPRIWVDLDCSFLSSVTKRWDLGIGKDFFLTREEAEKALEAMK